MTTKPAADVEVRLDTAEAEKDAESFSNKLETAFKGVSSALDDLKKVGRFVADTVKSMVGPAQEAERAQRALSTALRQQTADYEVHVRSLGRYNKALQESVGVDDDALAQLQAKLLLLGVLPSELERATQATIGLAEITGEDLSSAATKVTKVLDGNVEALKKMGIEGRSIADVLGKLDRGFESAQERAQTFGGRVNALEVAWGELKETIGTAIIENPEVKQGLEDLRAWIKDVTSTAETGKSKMSDYISTTVSGLRELVGFINDNKEAFATLLAVYGAAVVSGKIVALAKAVGPAVAAVAGSGAAATAAGVGGAAALGVSPILGLGMLPNVRDAIRASLLPQGGRIPLPAGIDAGVEYSPAWGADTSEQSMTFGVGEGLTVGGKKNASKDWARLQKEAEDRAQWTKERQEKALADMAENRDREREIAIAGLRTKREMFEAENALETLKRDQEADNAGRRWEIQQAQVETDEKFYQTMISTGVAGVGGWLSGLTSSIIQGKATVGGALGGLLGTIVSGVGQAMVGLGTAALAAASASSGIPLLWPIFGGPIGVGGSLAIIGAGSVLTGVGQGIAAAMGGSASSASNARAAAQTATSRAAARVPATAAPAGFVPPGAPSTNVTNINISFAGAIATGTPRQIARSLRDILREGGWMVPEGV